MNANQASKFKVHVSSKELMEMGPRWCSIFFSLSKDRLINQSTPIYFSLQNVKSEIWFVSSQSTPKFPLLQFWNDTPSVEVFNTNITFVHWLRQLARGIDSRKIADSFLTL